MGGTRLVQTKPVITVAQGYAYAGGLELFCHGHIRLAEPQATFSVACRRWGVPLVDGGTVYLPRLLGWGNALPLIITGERISAQRAFEIGLVWELVPEGSGLTRAMDIARQVCQQPRNALLADLASAINGLNRPLEEALEIEAANMYPVMRSESTARGLAQLRPGRAVLVQINAGPTRSILTLWSSRFKCPSRSRRLRCEPGPAKCCCRGGRCASATRCRRSRIRVRS